MKEVIVFGADWCGFCHGVRSWLEKNNIAYTYKNVDVDGRDEMHTVMPNNETIPVVKIGNEAFVNPSYDQLGSMLLQNEDDNQSTETEKVLIYGADWCGDCHMARSWLDEHNIKYEYHNVDTEGRDAMHEALPDNESIPVIVIGNKVLVEPTADELNKAFNISKKSSDDIYDVIMIGAGPASLSAAVYTSREDLKTLLFEKGVIGGLAAITDKVDNYPGFPKGIEGLTLADNLREQVERFGAKIELGEVQSIAGHDRNFTIHTTSGEFKTKSILVGTGSEWMKLGIPGETEYYGKGVHNCATCDGAFYRDKKLVVVGGGNSSAQESLFLTKFASHIDILVRGEAWKASDVLVREIESNEKITVHFNMVSEEIIGEDGKVTKVHVKNSKDNQEHDFETDGVFVFIGLNPVTYYLEGSGVELDERGFVKTNHKLETNVAGIFAAGDIRSGATMQIASAVGEGATAALSIREHLEGKNNG